MIDALPFILIPFLTALLQVLSLALAVGMIPALWYLWTRRQPKIMLRWLVVFLIIGAGGGYGFYKARSAWRNWVGPAAYKTQTEIFGYFVSVLTAPFLIPEPMRQARNRLRFERPSEGGRGSRRREGKQRDEHRHR